MCTITAQLDELVKDLRPRVTTNNEGKSETYYLVEYDTALLFGLTQFKASVKVTGEIDEEWQFFGDMAEDPNRKLVVAIDVGTTFSGVSYW
jgi:hypothetical protein